MSEPSLRPEPLKKWKELGPLDLPALVMQTHIDNPIKFTNPMGKNESNFSFDIQGQVDQDTLMITGIGRSNYRNILYEG